MSSILDDPFELHFQRDSRAGAGVLVVQFVGLDPGQDAAGHALADLVARDGRPVELRLALAVPSMGDALRTALEATEQPLILVSTAREPWTRAHLDPLLEAINRSDHVLGRRPASGLGSAWRWIAAWPRRIVFAAPMLDPHSPCQVHRREKLAAIPLQSRSWFLDVEILAKATFLGHLIDEAPVPAIAGVGPRRGAVGDARLVLKHPRFRPTLAPAKESQGQGEGHDAPGGEDRQGGGDVNEPRPLEHDRAHAPDHLG